MRMRKLIILAFMSAGLAAMAQDNIPPSLPKVDTSSPRASMKTFMDAMNDYRQGVETESDWHLRRLADARHCMHLEPLEAKRRKFYGDNAARHLKEVIDRVAVIDYDKIPSDNGLARWQFEGTAITMVKIGDGHRAGEYLFSSDTVQRVPELYLQVKHLPYIEGSGQGSLLGYQAPHAEGSLYIKTDNPRQTMRTFIEAMNDYRKGMIEGNAELKRRINDAIGCLEVNSSKLIDDGRGRQAAIFLKEVIDRIILIDYTKIPERESNGDPKLRWALKNSNSRIIIRRITEGDRAGEHLFDAKTVQGISTFYKEIRTQPYLEGSGKGAAYQPPQLEKFFPVWLRQEIFLFPNWQWAGLFLAILLGYAARAVTHYFVIILKRIAAKSKTEWDDKLLLALEGPAALLVASIFWTISVHLLRFEGDARGTLLLVVKVIFAVTCMWALYRLVDVLTEYLETIASRTDNAFDDHLVPLVQRAARTFVVLFGILITVQNLGYNVMSLLAGLGLGGLAFALAAKDTCANLFGSIMILTDRPFHIGEWVKIGGTEGTVEQIGFRSTRIRTFYDSLVTIPNSALANSNIDNMGRRTYRRCVARLGITYDTPPEKIEAFTEGIKNIFKANKTVRKDYFIVSLNEYAEFSLNIMLYFFFKVNNYSEEMMERHNVYLEILRLADDLGVSFAFPTQSIYLENMPEQGFQPSQAEFTQEEIKQAAASFGPNGQHSRPSGSGVYLPPHLDPELKK